MASLNDDDDVLSEKDKRYIKKYFRSKTSQQMSQYLEKAPSLISEYVDTLKKESDVQDKSDIVYPILQSLTEWKFLRQQYTPAELELFEQLYAEMREQFKDDILATERKQVFQAIELEIFMHRIKIERKRLLVDMDNLQQDIDDENDRSPEVRDHNRIESLQTRMEGWRNALGNSDKKYNEYLDRHSKILDKLKGTRDQRLKTIESSKVTFVGLIKMLQDREFRENEAKQIELMKQAMEKEKERLGAYHTFLDGEIDIPYLTPETTANKNNV
jgi:chromosome segregation ATPase